MNQQQPWWRRNLWVLALAGLVALSGAIFISQQVVRTQHLNDQQSTITGLQKKISSADEAEDSRVDQDQRKALGISPDRVKRDSKDIEKVLKTALAWDSGEDYEQAREMLQSRYKIDSNQPFLQSFMPASRFNKDSSGQKYYYIDTVGMSSSPGKNLDVQVESVEGTTYNYVATIDAEITSDRARTVDPQGNTIDGSSSARQILAHVSVDGDGNIKTIDGITAGSATRTSG
jgi:hypothetical protein